MKKNKKVSAAERKGTNASILAERAYAKPLPAAKLAELRAYYASTYGVTV